MMAHNTVLALLAFVLSSCVSAQHKTTSASSRKPVSTIQDSPQASSQGVKYQHKQRRRRRTTPSSSSSSSGGTTGATTVRFAQRQTRRNTKGGKKSGTHSFETVCQAISGIPGTLTFLNDAADLVADPFVGQEFFSSVQTTLNGFAASGINTCQRVLLDPQQSSCHMNFFDDFGTLTASGDGFPDMSGGNQQILDYAITGGTGLYFGAFGSLVVEVFPTTVDPNTGAFVSDIVYDLEFCYNVRTWE